MARYKHNRQVGQQLKALRLRTGLRRRDIAVRVGMPASTYQNYEERFVRPYLPLQMVARLVTVFKEHGIDAQEVWTLADATDVEAFLEAWQVKTEEVEESAWRPSNGGRRRYERWNPMAASLSLDGERHPCVVQDISPGGACVWAETALKLREAAKLLLEVSEFGQVPAQVTRREDNEIGLTFQGDANVERDMATWLTPLRLSRELESESG